MTNKNLKESLALIRKLAQDFAKREGPGTGGGKASPPAKPPGTPPGTPPAKPGDRPAFRPGGGGGGGGGAAATTAIKAMQQAMQEFANKVTAYSVEKGKGPPDAKGKPTDQVSGERKDFNDFITEQYLATSDVKGVEWSKDPKAMSQADKSKQQTDLIEMDYVVDGLKRIGNMKTSELVADNFWDFRTNNALKNIYAFAYALLNVEKDFGKGATKIFNARDLAAMHENIPMQLKDPSRTLSAQDKVARAEALTPLIEKLGTYYEHYVKKIALNPYYRTYIEKQSPMFTVKAQDEDPGTMNATEKQRYDSIGDSINIPGNVVMPAKSGEKPLNISLYFLKDEKNFTQLMTQVLGYSEEEATYPAYRKAVLDAMLKHVNDYLSQAPQPQKPQEAPKAPQAQQTPPRQ